jgi:hypothetical protein
MSTCVQVQVIELRAPGPELPRTLFTRARTLLTTLQSVPHQYLRWAQDEPLGACAAAKIPREKKG